MTFEFDPARAVRKTRLSEQGANDDLSSTTTAEERFAMMWQIAQDAWAFIGEPVVEPRMDRSVVRVIRQGRK